ncbi:MAG TPA: AbrB/MazE/SpoVT family DNA-binding domain-containing protein, partial [Candidatus Glassbacteria bacterium]|nr:AbrB/MazE/SpoVT family DNA-binding domain-containing protein [Candidatus Glassbacteria bacterium]
VCKYEVVRECDGPRPDSEHLYKYDDSADEDVWDDDVDDVVNDEDWGDDVVNDEEDVVNDALDEVFVKPDNRGRVCVPKSMIDALGLSENDPVVAEIGNGQIILYGDKSDVKTDSSTRVYIVDKDHNIRISAYALELAELGDRKMLSVGLDFDDDSGKIITIF